MNKAYTLITHAECATFIKNVSQKGGNMRELSIREFRASIGHLNQLAEQLGEIIVTNRGRPILRILPIHAKINRPHHRDLRQKTSLLKTSSAQLIREDRDER